MKFNAGGKMKVATNTSQRGVHELAIADDGRAACAL